MYKLLIIYYKDVISNNICVLEVDLSRVTSLMKLTVLKYKCHLLYRGPHKFNIIHSCTGT